MKKTKKRIYFTVKRGLDIFFSLILLIFSAIPMLIIWAAVIIDTPGAGIFKQIRVGKDGKLFRCYKFRTMYASAPPCRSSAEFADSHKYITPVGKFLRRSSLDELPQLFNVLKGDMSIVGPRPLIISEETVHSGRRANGVYALRPGITGLAQVRGRDRLGDEQKVLLDTRYLQEVGFIADAKILGETFFRVARGEDIK